MITVLFMAVSVLALIAMFKVTGFLLGIFGKLLGVLFSAAGYVLIGILVIGAIGFGMIIIPVVFIAGLISIVSNIGRLI